MKCLIICIAVIFAGNIASASCNFDEQIFAESPVMRNDVRLINIEIKKSRTWSKSLVEAAVSRRETIDPKFKKWFKADVKVHYPIGICSYKAKVRLMGEFKDHLTFLMVIFFPV